MHVTTKKERENWKNDWFNRREPAKKKEMHLGSSGKKQQENKEEYKTARNEYVRICREEK